MRVKRARLVGVGLRHQTAPPAPARLRRTSAGGSPMGGSGGVGWCGYEVSTRTSAPGNRRTHGGSEASCGRLSRTSAPSCGRLSLTSAPSCGRLSHTSAPSCGRLSDVEQEVDNIPVLHHVSLTLSAQASGFAGGDEGADFVEVGVGDDFGTDETPLNVRVDASAGIGSR